jgi:nicotinamidase-related amidase
MRGLKVNREDSVLVLVDFQERLMPAMKNAQELELATLKLTKGCKAMGLPALITQQYTKGLGATIQSIQEALGEYEAIEKTSFSVMGEPAFVEALEKTGRRTVILAGIEAHVCVQQTALDLLENGYSVFLVIDCISSRSNNDKKYAQRRMSEAGAIGTTYEAILFELCGGSKDPNFKDISALVK